MGVGLIVVFALGAAVIKLLLHDFVVPIMYLRRGGVLAAWSDSAVELPGNLLTFFLYFLMKILIGIVIGFLAISLTCLTCCLRWSPTSAR